MASLSSGAPCALGVTSAPPAHERGLAGRHLSVVSISSGKPHPQSFYTNSLTSPFLPLRSSLYSSDKIECIPFDLVRKHPLVPPKKRTSPNETAPSPPFFECCTQISRVFRTLAPCSVFRFSLFARSKKLLPCFQSLPHSFALSRRASALFSNTSALFAQNNRGWGIQKSPALFSHTYERLVSQIVPFNIKYAHDYVYRGGRRAHNSLSHNAKWACVSVTAQCGPKADQR
jgi:hypothetical protein